ncbi:MAG: thioredoxin family protein, partial [Planctomycetota bacterium]
MLLDADILRPKFDQGMSYAEFVALGEPEGHRPPWDQRYAELELDPAQEALVKSFTRPMNVLCLTGTWCGDCALQGSAMARIAEANPQASNLRFLLRHEQHADLIVKAPINAGFRVPVTWFMAEDFEPVLLFGDRTLSRYRSMARKQLPPDQANVHAPPPADPVREV